MFISVFYLLFFILYLDEENEVERIEVKTKVGTNEDIRLKFGPQQNTNDQNFHHYRSNNVSSHKNLKGK